jgi:hypothetical protein
MTTTGRKKACIVMFIFIVWGAIASATRFAAVAGAVDGPQSDAEATIVTTGSGTEVPAKTPNDGESCVTDSKRTIALRGKVLGPGDRPIAGARLYLSLDEWNDRTEASRDQGP